jgi:hypothetical protein
VCLIRVDVEFRKPQYGKHRYQDAAKQHGNLPWLEGEYAAFEPHRLFQKLKQYRRRRHAKADGVGERIKLLAKFGAGVQQSRRKSVAEIEHRRKQY